ncbi:MarR family winged helix-turn-helix transcriptional regulator [Spirosoma montaniterrae]|uniref:MarR family transcriptional regulator n=1 Tax=Spirosoma montaniterrae TaxID=1178516 RepID=A0A1P9WRB9_9BACT|nr:MarR family winged helix-turn-helix transcriptional regulator [Spirosoma montaniterrae]AQG77911.1 MarR family transcriptional regulator [Spirosoma montaniterrae]
MNNEVEATIAEETKSVTRYSACLLFSANALARAITAIGDDEFGRFGLSYSHAYLLCEVVDQPGVTPSELSETLYLTPSTITRLVEKLEQKHLLRRESEGKKTLIYATLDGEALRPAIAEAWQRVGARYSQAIGEENVCQFTQQVFRAAQSLEAI